MNRFRFIWRALSYRFKKDPAEIAAILRHIAPGDTVIDIGANKGGYTYWMARAAGPAGRVIAFEPQPGLAAYLAGVFAGSTVTVEPLGLSSKAGNAELVIPERGKTYSPGASLELTASAEFHSFNVPTDTLDHYCASKGLRRVSFIKCDVEGHELEVFKGAAGILKKDRPAVLFECESRHLSRHTIRDVFACLESLGYEGRFFLKRVLLPLAQFDEKVHQAGWGVSPLYANNFLFLPKEQGKNA